MKKFLPAVIIALLVIAVIIGVVVGRGNKKMGTNAPASTPSATTSQTNGSGKVTNPGSSQVSIENFSFVPATITVKKGLKVTWTNNDSTSHTVTADSGAGPSSPTLNPGGTYSFTFNSTGTFSYHCNFHSSMHGTVTVIE